MSSDVFPINPPRPLASRSVEHQHIDLMVERAELSRLLALEFCQKAGLGDDRADQRATLGARHHLGCDSGLLRVDDLDQGVAPGGNKCPEGEARLDGVT